MSVALYFPWAASSRNAAAISSMSTCDFGWRRRRSSPSRIDVAHDPDRVAIRVFDDGVPRSPERVLWILVCAVTGLGHTLEHAVDLFSQGDVKEDYRAARTQ